MTFDDLEAMRDWLVEKGHIQPEERDTVSIHACRTDDAALVASSSQQPPEEGREMADTPNEVKIGGTIKWEPKFFEPKSDDQKLIAVFAIEWIRPKSEKKSVFNIKAFGDMAETLKKENIAQGDEVVVSGSLNETNWKDKQTDEWKKQIEVWASKVEIGDRANGGDESGDFGGSTDADDDDIPF
jgi:hypothetical protein